MSNNTFQNRHIGSNYDEQIQMLNTLGYKNINQLIDEIVPHDIISKTDMFNHDGNDEYTALQLLQTYAKKNLKLKNYIGMGYYETITPSVVKRNVFENPGWYTAYTPYQAEISQGRLEALLNYQQMIMDLTGFDLANASLLDEATAAAESMSMAKKLSGNTNNKFFVDTHIFPQTLDVIKTRAKYQNIEIVVDDIKNINTSDYFGVFIQNPDLYGNLTDYTETIQSIKQANINCIICMAYDILSLVLFKSPKIMGVDIAIGSTQRFGIPIGFGGPSAAYMATNSENKRIMPGRIIGISKDSNGKYALRMSLQTREQHIRREKATSNICTAQALLANMAGFYAVYHGKDGLHTIAKRVHNLTQLLYSNLKAHGIKVLNNSTIFDTITIDLGQDTESIHAKLIKNGYALGKYNKFTFISIGETATITEIIEIFNLITNQNVSEHHFCANKPSTNKHSYQELYRTDNILSAQVFNKYQSETKMMRYLKKLENRDISLVHSMIPLGSCTMKLNAAATLEGISWPEFANIHPFAPTNTNTGYIELLNDFKLKLAKITGFSDISLQPNSGAQGEFAGLITIRRYQESINQSNRNICLIPKSAHGTNPASAHMVGLEVVVVNCDEHGNVDIEDLNNKATQYKNELSCLMITYPSTHGVFETNIKKICTIIHDNGGQVYMDGANLNALVGIVKPAEIGVDVSHINLHKTFAIPHGGGGPGMGPIGVMPHLAKFIPQHNFLESPESDINYAVSSSPYGSASILIISWMYITMLGDNGLKNATYNAILNANYIANRLKPYYKVLYTDKNCMVAHECIIDIRPIKEAVGITEVDFAKRLMDFGFHAPTMSFPVSGTLMIEPTESESKEELDRFINAMIKIYDEVKSVEYGLVDKNNNVLKNAPHTLADVSNWNKPYSINKACFPNDNLLKEAKIFPHVNRIDDAYGDRNFICNCANFEE